MIAAFDKGDVVRAREINAQLLESYAFENSDTCVFSQAAKAMMRTLGLPVGECRLPLGPAPAGTEDRARERLRAPARRRLMPAPVSVTFLGGLGEIGRNCACIEVDGRIMLLDCGLMFPDIDMLGHRPRAARTSRTCARTPDASTVASRPTGTKTTWAACRSCCASCSFPIYGSALTLGLARHRIEEAGLHRPHRARARARRRAAPDRAVRRRVHPRHALGAARVRHRVPHAARHDPAHRRLQARPDAGRRTAHRPRPHRRDRQGPGHPAAAVRLDQRRRGRPRRAASGRSAMCSTTCSTPTRAGASSSPASPATSTACSRSPTRRSRSTARSRRSACR